MAPTLAPNVVYQRTLLRQVYLRLRHNRATLFGTAIVALYVIAAILPDFISFYNPNDVRLEFALSPPSADHWLGTDEFGRDVLSRVLYGARLSLFSGFSAVAIGMVIGGFLGIVAAYYGRMVDMLIMRAMDILLSIPGIMLAIALVAVLGPGMTNVIIAVGLYNIPGFARMMRSTALSVKGEEYITAARMIGSQEHNIILRHLLPNCLGAPLVFGVLRFGDAIMVGSGLSFLGLGVQPPTAEWGAMLAASRNYIRVAPHLAFDYGITLSMLVLGVNMMGEGLRDVFDPTTVR